MIAGGDSGGADDDGDDYSGEADVDDPMADEQTENGHADVNCFSSKRPFPTVALNLFQERRLPEGADLAVRVGLTELVEDRCRSISPLD